MCILTFIIFISVRNKQNFTFTTNYKLIKLFSMFLTNCSAKIISRLSPSVTILSNKLFKLDVIVMDY